MKKELYTKEELAFFQSLEKDIDSWNYEPMETQKLEKKRKETKKIAENTIRKRTKKKTVNIRLYEDDLEKIKLFPLKSESHTKLLSTQQFISLQQRKSSKKIIF